MSRLFNRKRYGGAGKRREGGIPFHQRHRKAITRTLTAVILIGLAGVGYAYNLNRKFQNIDRVKVDLNEKNRPDPDKGQALNLLLLGSDKGETSKPEWKGSTLADDVRSGDWPSGKYRSDTIMIVHISEDRKHVYLVSIPRDSFTMLYDEEGNAQRKEKVNAAFSYYGPTGAISTIEHLSDLRMKHMAIIDWDGFKDLTTALGGVEIYIPETFRDPKQNVTWESGTQLLKGNKALAYVRTRYGLIDGDFDRIARQQNFLRATMKKTLDSGTMRNPLKLNNTLEAITKNLTVDSDWNAGDMRGLALSLRGTEEEDVTFMTLPIAGSGQDPTYGSILNIDQAKSEELFQALRDDTVDKYLKKYPDEVLKAPEEVQ